MAQCPSESFWVFSQWVLVPWVGRTSRNMAPGAYARNPSDTDRLSSGEDPAGISV